MFEVELITLLQSMNPISFGDNTPAPPYVVIKPDEDVLRYNQNNRFFRRYRI